MVATSPEGYIPIIGVNFLHPIATLLEGLEKHSSKAPNEVQANPYENGYSIAIITLTVFLIESTLNRIKSLKKTDLRKNPVEFVAEEFPTSGYAEKIEELFVVRDVIAHNHVWNAKIYWDDNYDLRLVSAEIHEQSGDKKYKKGANPEKRKSRLLEINLFPTRICRTDCVLVLKTAVDFLLYLENIDRNFIYLSHQTVEFKGRLTPFIKIIGLL